MSSGPHARLGADQRRSQILDVARSEFIAKGFAGARVQAVADAAGVHNALIYKHFRSKEELFEAAVMAPVHALLAARIEAVRSLPTDPDGGAQRESTRQFVLVLLQMFIESIRTLGVVLFGDLDNAQRFYGSHIRPMVDACIEVTTVNLPRWRHNEFDVEVVTQSLFGAAFWLALDRSMRHTEVSVQYQVDALISMIFEGISAASIESVSHQSPWADPGTIS